MIDSLVSYGSYFLIYTAPMPGLLTVITTRIHAVVIVGFSGRQVLHILICALLHNTFLTLIMRSSQSIYNTHYAATHTSENKEP